MKISKTRLFIILAICLALGSSYLFMAEQAQTEKRVRALPSTGATLTEAPALTATSPVGPPEEPAHHEPAPKLAQSARGAYPISTTVAAKPAKVEGYRPPQYDYEGVLKLEGGETCDDAVAISLPHNSTGNTCDNVNDYDEYYVFDCPYSGSTSPDVVYSYTPSVDQCIDIDLYGSSYDTKVYVYENTCESPYCVACNDDFYPDYVSAIFGLDIFAGNTYYIVVDGYGYNCGDYLLNVSECVECDVVCPPGGIDENEPVCYDGYVDAVNGGCNWTPLAFGPINCGDTICGTSGVYAFDASTYREMDWFSLDLATPATLTWTGVGEFPVALWILDAGSQDCSDVVSLAFDSGLPCDTVSISADVPPGVYWFIIAPVDWGDYPCGVEYVAWLDCEVATTGACCNDLEPYDCQITTPEECADLPDHTFLGLGTNCGPPNPCLPAPDNDSCQNAPQLYPPDCPSVQTVSGTTIGATIDCPDVLNWDAVWYKFELPYECNNVYIDYCPTNSPDTYTRGVVLYDECQPDCPNYILYTGLSWVTCPSGYTDLTVWWNNLPAGMYWLPVFAHDWDDNPMDFVFDICIEECEPLGPGDNCDDPKVVPALPAGLPYTDAGQTTCGRVDDYENTCLGYYDGGEDIIYEVTVTTAVDVDITMDPKGTTWTGLAIDDECPPADPCMAFNTGSSGIRTLPGIHLEPGTYYIMVDTWPSPDCIPDFDLTITEAAEAPENDTCQGAPISDTFPDTLFGTTVGATIDCPGVLDWDAVWYRFDVPYASNNILVNFCPSEDYIVTVGIVLYDECPPDCPGYIIASGYSWVYCENTGLDNPNIWWNDMPGPASYWFPVYVVPGKAPMDFGFEVTVEEAVPCTVACPEGGIPENEPWCEDDWEDVWNGGCNSWPYVFEDVNCGDTICGTAGTYLYYGSNYRDTDWFRVEVGDGNMTFKCVAEFELQTILIDAGSEDCVDYTILDWRQVGKCDTATITWYCPAGVYWLWVGTTNFSGVECGSDYVMMVDCVPFGPQMVVDPASMYPVLNPAGPCSSATEDLTISSVGGENLIYTIAENPPVDWMDLSSTSGTVPPGEEDVIQVSFDAGGMAPGDYYCDLEIDHNDPSLPDPYVVAVHLEVELAPEVDMAPRKWMPVIPGCTMDESFRISNLGEGELHFEISVQQNAPPLMAGKNNIREALEALRMAGKADPSLTPREAYKTIGAKRSTIKLNNVGTSEGLLLSAGAGVQANILLVDDDGGLPGGTYYDIEDIYMNALDANGFVYDYYVVDWVDPESPGPDLATMQNYTCVIWFCGETWGYYGDDTFTPTDEVNVGAYLDGGGNLFLSAQDYFWDMYPSAGSFSSGQFPYDYLHVSSVNQDWWNDPYTVFGGAGSVAEGMQFDCLRFTDNPDVPLWTDVLTGRPGAVDVFLVQGTDPSALQYDAGTYKIVYTTTEFAGLVDASPSTRAEFMASIINWFGCVGPACPFTVYPEEGDIPGDSFFDVTLTFDGTLFEECVDDTLICYMVVTSNDCDEPVVTVDVLAWSARGDVSIECEPCIINIGDVIFLLNFIFGIGPAPDPLCMGDVTRDDPVNVDTDDALYLISYLFTGGPPPEIPTAPMEEQTPIQLK